MVAYEFYFHDQEKGDHLIGILPERRRDAERINKESIMRWAKMVLGNRGDTKKIYYVQVKLE